MFNFESIEFTTNTVMKREKSRLMIELCSFLGVERDSFRLQRGNVTLYGKTSEGIWFPLTSNISDFPERISQKGYTVYKLKTKLQIKEK